MIIADCHCSTAYGRVWGDARCQLRSPPPTKYKTNQCNFSSDHAILNIASSVRTDNRTEGRQHFSVFWHQHSVDVAFWLQFWKIRWRLNIQMNRNNECQNQWIRKQDTFTMNLLTQKNIWDYLSIIKSIKKALHAWTSASSEILAVHWQL